MDRSARQPGAVASGFPPAPGAVPGRLFFARLKCGKTARIEGERYEIIGSFCNCVLIVCVWIVGY